MKAFNGSCPVKQLFKTWNSKTNSFKVSKNMFSQSTSFWTLVLLLLFGVNWISQSFSIPNFINSRSQMFSQINVFKKYTKFRGKRLYRNLFQASNFCLIPFIKEEIPAQLYSCEFCETFKNIFFPFL